MEEIVGKLDTINIDKGKPEKKLLENKRLISLTNNIRKKNCKSNKQ